MLTVLCCVCERERYRDRLRGNMFLCRFLGMIEVVWVQELQVGNQGMGIAFRTKISHSSAGKLNRRSVRDWPACLFKSLWWQDWKMLKFIAKLLSLNATLRSIRQIIFIHDVIVEYEMNASYILIFL